jgi:hypothetical protein
MGEAKWKREHRQQPTNNFVGLALVIDRAIAARITDEEFNSLGGAWTEMVNTWRQSGKFAYLVLLAHTAERMAKSAPLTAMAVDDNGLRIALRKFCEELSDMKCRWILWVEPGSVAETIAHEELLLDTKVEGRA